MTLILEALKEATEDNAFFDAEGPCPALLEPGDDNSRVVVISGENAGGKSLFGTYLDQWLKKRGKADQDQIQSMLVGMALRTQAGMHRAFIWGEEGRNSTGSLSARAVLGGLNTCRNNENRNALLLDEPDIGLSESVAQAMGVTLARFAADMPEKMVALVVITHSRPLVRELMDLNPHCVRVGPDHRPTREWLEHGPLPVGDLEDVTKTNLERMREVSRLFQNTKTRSPSP